MASHALLLPFGFCALMLSIHAEAALGFRVLAIGGGAMAASVGATLAAHLHQRRMMPVPSTLRQTVLATATHWLVWRPHILVAFVIGGLMPLVPARWQVMFLVGGVAVALLGASGGGLLLAERLGLVVPASPRLRAIMELASAKAGRTPREVHEMELGYANALAFPLLQRVAFTRQILEQFDDAALESVAAHELSHLGEPTRVGLARLASGLWILVLAGWIPLERHVGSSGVMLLVAGSLMGASFVMRLARRMEQRADEAGCAHERASGDYARALERLHEVNLIPVVLGGKNRTHPELYDRLIAAGRVPDYPRPPAPSKLVPWLAIFLPFIATLLVFPFAHGFFLRWLELAFTRAAASQ